MVSVGRRTFFQTSYRSKYEVLEKLDRSGSICGRKWAFSLCHLLHPSANYHPAHLYPPITCQALFPTSFFQFSPPYSISLKKGSDSEHHPSMPTTDPARPAEYLQHFAFCKSFNPITHGKLEG